MTVDPRPFEPAMPDDVREALELGRAGQGPAADWIAARYPRHQIDATLALVRGGPVRIAGWLAGIAMFGDTKRVIAGTIDRERLYAVIPHLLDAFGAGFRAKVKPTKHQWGSIERLVTRSSTASSTFIDVLPLAVCVESAITRDHACRIAALIGEPARQAIEAARTGASRRDGARLDAALATSIVEPVDSTAEGDLLRRLLVEWRATRDPVLELPIARLGRMLATARGPIVERREASFYETEGIWQRRARERDPADLDVLLDVQLPWFGDARARVEQLAKREPDPRLARFLVLAVSYPLPDLFDQVATTLASHMASPGLVDTLDAIERLEPKLASAIATLRAAITESRPADPALVAEALAATRRRAELDELFAQVARDPDDLGLRAVLADALQAAGDPRGEFIALQLAIDGGAAKPKLRARAGLLLDTHFRAWTAEVPRLSRAQSRFERGFLVATAYEGTIAGLALSAGLPLWQTIEALEVTLRGVDLAPIVRGAPRLHTITTGHLGALEDLAVTGPHPNLRALGCLYEGWLPQHRANLPGLAVVGGTWHGTTALSELRAAITVARTLGLDALVWFDSVDFSSFDGSLELRFTLTRGRGGGFWPNGWAVRVPRAGPIQLAWSGPPDAPDFESDLRSLVGHASQLRRGPCELYLPATMTCPSGVDVVPGRPIDLTAANRT